MIDPSRIIFGCANFGGIGSAPELRGQGQDASAAAALLDAARDLGLFMFDTANTYGGGDSERILGAWLSRQTPAFRKKAVIFTKVGNPIGTREGHNPLSRSEIEFHSRRSLARLTKIDVYLLHQPDPSTPIQETIQAFKRALADGRIGAVGLSNVDRPYVEEFLSRAEHAGIRPKVGWVQNQFNFLKRRDAAGLLSFLDKASLAYAAASPLAGGVLAGGYRPHEPVPRGSRPSLRPDLYGEYLTPEAFQEIEKLRARASRHGRALAEEALRFVLEQAGTSAVIGVSRLEQFAGLGLRRDAAAPGEKTT